MTARLTDEDHRRLASLATTLGLPRAEVISKALAALERSLRRP